MTDNKKAKQDTSLEVDLLILDHLLVRATRSIIHSRKEATRLDTAQTPQDQASDFARRDCNDLESKLAVFDSEFLSSAIRAVCVFRKKLTRELSFPDIIQTQSSRLQRMCHNVGCFQSATKIETSYICKFVLSASLSITISAVTLCSCCPTRTEHQQSGAMAETTSEAAS